MARLIVAGSKLCVVYKACEEDNEEYWDRAWAWVNCVSLRRVKQIASGSNWERSFSAAYERKGVVY
jgi:hypothetical protein